MSNPNRNLKLRRGARLVLAAVLTGLLAPSVFAAGLPINDVQAFYELPLINNRGDEALAIDGDPLTSSYLTPDFNELPSLATFDFGGSAVDINRFRVNKFSNADPSPGIDNMDLQLLYTTDTGALETRNYVPVTGLTSGYNGMELINADAVNPGNATVDNDHHDFASDGLYSLTFDDVSATGLALRFAGDPTNPLPYVNYRTSEFEILHDATPASITDIQVQRALDAPRRINTNLDAMNAVDGDLFTETFLVKGGPPESANIVTPQIAAFDLGGSVAINRFRADKYGDVDGIAAGAPGLAPTDNMDLQILYSTDTGPLSERNYQPVSGLTNGYAGSQLINADLVDPSTATVDNDHHDTFLDGPYSLSFDTVNATAFAFRLERDAADTSSVVRYRNFELDVLEGDTERAVSDLQVFDAELPAGISDTELITRADAGASYDGDIETISYVVGCCTTEPVTVALDLGAEQGVGRLRVAKISNLDGGAPAIDNADLEILYTTDTGPIKDRTFQPVTNLVNGNEEGEELLVADAVNADGTVVKDHHDFATDGWYSLRFDAVNATALAIHVTRSEGDAQPFPFYPTYEFEVYAATVAPGLEGDYNGNGVVDAADYTVWRNTLGATANLAADGNNNNTIDSGDYDTWKNNFGATASGSSVPQSAVPEPTAVSLCLAALLGLIGYRPRRRRATR